MLQTKEREMIEKLEQHLTNLYMNLSQLPPKLRESHTAEALWTMIHVAEARLETLKRMEVAQ